MFQSQRRAVSAPARAAGEKDDAARQVSKSRGGLPGHFRNATLLGSGTVDTTDPRVLLATGPALARMGIRTRTQRHRWTAEASPRGLSVPLLVCESGCRRKGMVYFSSIRQIFMKRLSVPGAILGTDAGFLHHISHKHLVVLAPWSMTGTWQGPQAAVSIVWRGGVR